MNFAYDRPQPTRHATAVGAVLLLHLIVGYALVSGLARKVVEIYRKPVEVSIVEEVKEVKPPPPPKPPPPVKAAVPPPAPPAYVPPPETPVAAAPAPSAITATTAEAPPPPPAPAPAPAPAPQAAAVGAVCPNHVAVRSRVPYPPLALRQGLSGEVLVEFTVSADGRIGGVAVVKSTSPLFEGAAVDAIGKLQCVGQGQPVRVRVPFAFRLEN